MSKELMPFYHRLNGSSYLFGYEDYMTFTELQEFWGESLRNTKDFSEIPYGELTRDDVILNAANMVGLRLPARGSKLQEYVMEEAGVIVDYEYERVRQAEAGEIDLYENVDSYDPEIYGTMKNEE